MPVECFEGGCDCGYVRYQMQLKPLIVHCCHCTWCQRESGAAFALNALIESERLTLLTGEVNLVKTPTKSGRGQLIARCPHCFIALWSHYSGYGRKISFVRVGTLDDPEKMPPDIHIFTSTKQSWVILPEGVLAKNGYYSITSVWSKESLERKAALTKK